MSVPQPPPTANAKDLRRALGSFATGVTIITTRTAEGQPLGLTVNSFNSVSLNPPLVLWSLSNSSRSHDAFRNASHWAVHVLATDQQSLSARFAQTGLNKFEGLATEPGIGGIPLLRDCTARFQCRAAFQYEGGDHVIFVGEVVEFDFTGTAPLVFHGGRYARTLHAGASPAQSDQHSAGEIHAEAGPDSVATRVARLHTAIADRISPWLREAQLSLAEFDQLNALSRQALTHAADETAFPTDPRLLTDMQPLEARGLIRMTRDGEHGGGYELTEAGAARVLQLRSSIDALEAGWRQQLGLAEEAALVRLLGDCLNVVQADPSKSAAP